MILSLADFAWYFKTFITPHHTITYTDLFFLISFFHIDSSTQILWTTVITASTAVNTIFKVVITRSVIWGLMNNLLKTKMKFSMNELCIWLNLYIGLDFLFCLWASKWKRNMLSIWRQPFFRWLTGKHDCLKCYCATL